MSLPNPPPPEPVSFANEMETREYKPTGDLGGRGASESHNKSNAKIEDEAGISDEETDEIVPSIDDDDFCEASELSADDGQDNPSGGGTDGLTAGKKSRLRNRWELLILVSWEMRLPVIHMDFIR